MHLRFLLLSLCMILAFSAFGQTKHIVKSWPDGSPQVIVYTKGKGAKQVKVKEEGYFESGILDYTGNFKNGVEHGEWVYYYQDGTKKFVEFYKNGVEDGIQYEYHPDGQLRSELHYKNGQLLKRVDHR